MHFRQNPMPQYVYMQKLGIRSKVHGGQVVYVDSFFKIKGKMLAPSLNMTNKTLEERRKEELNRLAESYD